MRITSSPSPPAAQARAAAYLGRRRHQLTVRIEQLLQLQPRIATESVVRAQQFGFLFQFSGALAAEVRTYESLA